VDPYVQNTWRHISEEHYILSTAMTAPDLTFPMSNIYVCDVILTVHRR